MRTAVHQAAVATHEDSDNLLHYAGGEFACPLCRQVNLNPNATLGH